VSDRKPVLRPDAYDPDWIEFRDALDDELGDPAEFGRSGLCKHDHYYAKRLLEARGFDAEASLALYEKRGGSCDCEILFNVDPPTLEDELDEERRRPERLNRLLDDEAQP
jgi:Protein of unknown function (DUF2695)